MDQKEINTGNSLVVQQLGLHKDSVQGGMNSILGWGTKIPHAVWYDQKKKKVNK